MRNKFIYVLAILLVISTVACQQNGVTEKNVKLETSIDSVSYALGVLIGSDTKNQLKSFPGNENLDMEKLISAFKLATLEGEPVLTEEEANNLVQVYYQTESEKEAQSNLDEGNAFLEQNKTREGVITTESGLQYEIIKEGTGEKPKATDQVRVNYHGTLIDGTVFDSSVDRGEPVVFGVNQVIPGWQEALQLMPVGSKWKVYIPADLAYGERGAGGAVGPNSVLIFEVELLEIVES